jgi:hypothetical protein
VELLLHTVVKQKMSHRDCFVFGIGEQSKKFMLEEVIISNIVQNNIVLPSPIRHLAISLNRSHNFNTSLHEKELLSFVA